MRFEVLHTEGCSGYEATEKELRAALAEEGVEEAEVGLVEVRTEEEAKRLRFPGSPTVRAWAKPFGWRDLFPPSAASLGPGGGYGLG